jgi:hypothetical protein
LGAKEHWISLQKALEFKEVIMSITFGIYDFFSFTIPGVFYLFVVNEFLNLLNLPHLILKDVTIPQLVLLAVLAFIAGHLMDIVSFSLWYQRLKRSSASKDGLEELKTQCPTIEIGFLPSEWAALFYILHQKNYPAIQTIDKYKADTLMMRNLSFGLLLFAMLQIAVFIINGYSLLAIILFFLSLLFSVITLRRSMRYDRWYYRAIFAGALIYGTSLLEIIDKEKNSRDKSVSKLNQNESRRKKPKREVEY